MVATIILGWTPLHLCFYVEKYSDIILSWISKHRGEIWRIRTAMWFSDYPVFRRIMLLPHEFLNGRDDKINNENNRHKDKKRYKKICHSDQPSPTANLKTAFLFPIRFP